MDLTLIVMWLGFILASYSVVGNDVIQTLGTFLTSNEKRVQWWVLWLYAGSILAAVLIYGYVQQDIAYGRLDKFTFPETYAWYFLLPPLVLMTITRLGIPVSTTFMILTLFSLESIPVDLNSMIGSVFDTEAKLGGMIQKSLMGYVIAFGSGILIYLVISRLTEKYFMDNPISKKGRTFWSVAQWLSTAFLWSQWLTQDLANIYIYLKGGLGIGSGGFTLSLLILLGLLAYIFYRKGGAVQEVVRRKTNTEDIRSATFVDLIYGVILYIFKYDYFGLWGAKIPMSTTWVFIGLLAGRELAIRLNLERKITGAVGKMILSDFVKVFLGLVVSVVLVFVIKLLAG
jgi:phosphate/sulfate permease